MPLWRVTEKESEASRVSTTCSTLPLLTRNPDSNPRTWCCPIFWFLREFKRRVLLKSLEGSS